MHAKYLCLLEGYPQQHKALLQPCVLLKMTQTTACNVHRELVGAG